MNCIICDINGHIFHFLKLSPTTFNNISITLLTNFWFTSQHKHILRIMSLSFS